MKYLAQGSEIRTELARSVRKERGLSFALSEGFQEFRDNFGQDVFSVSFSS